jgi:hypothetical protein
VLEVGTAAVPAVLSLDEHVPLTLRLSRNFGTSRCIVVTYLSGKALLNASLTAADGFGVQ